MTQLTKKQRYKKRKDNLNALVTFIKPVHKSISAPLDPTALSSVAETSARNTFVKNYKETSKEKGVAVTQALLYENLLGGDVQPVEVNEICIEKDSIYFKQFSDELKAAGMFNRAKAIDLLLAKTKFKLKGREVFTTPLPVINSI